MGKRDWHFDRTDYTSTFTTLLLLLPLEGTGECSIDEGGSQGGDGSEIGWLPWYTHSFSLFFFIPHFFEQSPAACDNATVTTAHPMIYVGALGREGNE